MRYRVSCAVALVCAALTTMPVTGAVIYNNLTPNNLIAVAARPDTGVPFEIEAADDFILGSQTIINQASFTGLLVPGPQGGTTSITDIIIEMYRVFPLDSNAARTPNVPTRMNSPSDVAFDSRDSSGGELTFNTSVLSASFSALNSIQPGGIHPSPGQTTGGNGPITGQEVQINVTFLTPFNLPADHFFFVPQVALSNGGTFYWLSANRPITGTGGTTPITPDLQSWTRDQMLDPDWLRVGMDIVGGTTPPTFNQAFSLDGTVVPEPGSVGLILAGIGLVAVGRMKARKSRNRSSL